MRALIEDGPHAGQVIDVQPGLDVVELVDPGSEVLRPATHHRYLRQRPQPLDMQRGIDVRYRWQP